MKFWEDLRDVSWQYYEKLLLYLPRIVLAVIIFTIIWLGARRLQRLLHKRLSASTNDPLLCGFLAQIIKVTLVLFGLLLALGIIGLGGAASGLLAGAGVGAFIIGFAFKDIGENFLAGIIMAFDRPFRIGDWVLIGGYDGKIVGLTLRDVHLKTFDGRDVYVPNGMIVKNPIVNYTIDGFLRQEFTVRLGKETDMERAISVIKGELSEISGVLQKERLPDVFIGDFTPQGLSVKVQYWLDTINPVAPGLQVRTKAISVVIRALLREGFDLRGEVREVKMRTE